MNDCLRIENYTILSCGRCGKTFGASDVLKAEKHAYSDAEHLDFGTKGYTERSGIGRLLYPLLMAGWALGPLQPNEYKDERFRKKPIYEIFIRGPDGKPEVLETVHGSFRAQVAREKHQYELLKKEGKKVPKRLLGIPLLELPF